MAMVAQAEDTRTEDAEMVARQVSLTLLRASPTRIATQTLPSHRATRRGRQGAQGAAAARRAFYVTFRQLPAWAQRLAIHLGAAKVTYGACAVVQDSRGRVLLAHHTYRQRAWGLPGGLIRRNEQPSEAVERELREELGVCAVVGPLLYAETCLPSGHLTLYYRATLAGVPRSDGVELDGLHYANLDEAAALLGPEARRWLDCIRTRQAS